MNHLIIFTIYAILMIAVMGAGLLISKNQWLAADVKPLTSGLRKYRRKIKKKRNYYIACEITR